MKTRKRLCYAATLLALFCLSSCDQNDSDNTLLPAGKYPMAFTPLVNELAVTRATPDNTWDGGETVTLQVGDEMKLYKISGSGSSSTLTSDKPFYWTSSNETKSVCGWYCGNGYSNIPLKSWEVQFDQSDVDNYKGSDLLYAPAQDISFADENKSLTFYHQTARVVINIVNAEVATDANQIKYVVFGDNDNLALAGTYTAPNGTKGETFGTWEIDAKSFSTIAPKEITPSDSKYLKSYTALLIPQNMQGKKFIAITLTDEKTYYYTPKEINDANFEAGKEYTYDVTVKFGKLDAVKVSVSSDWGSNGNPIEVTSKLLAPGFSVTDLKIGDYYYSDGTTSDGGYRKYADGTSEVLSILPVETSANGNGRHVIGIVYSTNVSRIGEAATNFLTEVKGVIPRGLVMALTNASNGCRWGQREKDENGNSGGTDPFQDNNEYLQKMYNNVDGYAETHWMIDAYSGETFEKTYSAFYYANRYGTAEGGTSQYAAPDKTTGWFIPSMGQCWDILSNFGELDLSSYQAGGSYYAIIRNKAQITVDNMNKYLEKISGATKFSIGNNLWSSSENSSLYACQVSLYSRDDSLRLEGGIKDFSNIVRCVLAF